jgi:hypothetical protein
MNPVVFKQILQYMKLAINLNNVIAMDWKARLNDDGLTPLFPNPNLIPTLGLILILNPTDPRP